jgi:hypothetical protein
MFPMGREVRTACGAQRLVEGDHGRAVGGAGRCWFRGGHGPRLPSQPLPLPADLAGRSHIFAGASDDECAALLSCSAGGFLDADGIDPPPAGSCCRRLRLVRPVNVP